jgi:membrane-bound lytic murein transglycosylase B
LSKVPAKFQKSYNMKGRIQTYLKRSGASHIAGIFMNLFLLVAACTSGLAAPPSTYNERLDNLLLKLKTCGLSEKELDLVFSDPRVALYPEIVERRGKGLDYTGRRFGLLTKPSVKQGKAVLQKNRNILVEIEDSYGVGREILVAILRVETNFGRFVGTTPIFNSLLTMALIENRRSDWAGAELGHLLQFCREQKRDPLSIKGSWAGAFGLPQFIPSSYVKYGVDGNGDGIVDLDNLSDALASMANYLKSSGWSMTDTVRKKEALYAYNRCENYVQAVLAYASALTNK